ncbi:hypothetical protein [Mycobacterium shigaense]|uniref:hypothetical protein n=1 Tax=Mycobacterium shigaense TaxID=722731 RepID=UPI001969089F|nr:hypothetical protein [Mycobacterium shigaense]
MPRHDSAGPEADLSAAIRTALGKTPPAAAPAPASPPWAPQDAPPAAAPAPASPFAH